MKFYLYFTVYNLLTCLSHLLNLSLSVEHTKYDLGNLDRSESLQGEPPFFLLLLNFCLICIEYLTVFCNYLRSICNYLRTVFFAFSHSLANSKDKNLNTNYNLFAPLS